MTCNVPCSNTTLHPTQLTRLVDCHPNLISSRVNPSVIIKTELITAYNQIFLHDNDLDPVP